MWDQIQKKIRKTTDTIRTAIYSRISSVIKADNTVYVEIAEDEEIRDVRMITPFGIFSLPTVGTFGQVIFNNSAKKASLIGIEPGETPVVLDIGEVLVYRPGSQCYIHFKNDDKIYIKGETVFGEGTKGFARVDDTIEVVIGGTTYIGIIKTGSNTVKG